MGMTHDTPEQLAAAFATLWRRNLALTHLDGRQTPCQHASLTPAADPPQTQGRSDAAGKA